MHGSSIATDGAAVSETGRAWYVAVAILSLMILVYAQTWRELWPLWMDTDRTSYTHGVLVAAVAAWLVWRARLDLRDAVVSPVAWAIPGVLALSAAWMIFAKAGVFTAHAVLWPVLAWLAILATCGWRVAARLAFPIGFLWFAVPAWDYINPVLQRLTVIAVGAMNHLTRVPAVVTGDIVTIPSGHFEIAAGCSGLHFFMVALAIAALAGELSRDRLGTRLLLLIIAAVLALVTNWVRVYSIILAGHLTDMQHYLVRVDHYKFGWVLFAIAMTGFFLVLRQLPSRPVVDGTKHGGQSVNRHWVVFLAGLAAATLLPLTSWAVIISRGGTMAPGLQPRVIDGYSGPLSASPAWRPDFAGPEGELRVAYMSTAGRVMDLYVNRYFQHAQGQELVGYWNRLVDGSTLRESSTSAFEVDWQGAIRRFNRLDAIAANGSEWVILSRYYVGLDYFTGRLATQVSIGIQSFWEPTPSGLEAAAAPCAGDCESTARDLSTLLLRLTEAGE